MSHLPRRTSRTLLSAAAAGALCFSALGGVASADDKTPQPLASDTPAVAAGTESAPTLKGGRYIVMLKEAPAASYEGGTKGLKRTKPAKGEKFNAANPAVAAYDAHLTKAQKDVAKRNGVSKAPFYRYTTAVNGFATELTADEANRLVDDPAVLSVSPVTIEKLDTSRSPEFLGLSGKNGVWSQLSSSSTPSKFRKGPKYGPGNGVIVGVIDSGIRPENPSFHGKYLSAPPKKWRGECQSDDLAAFPLATCNNKLIGARYYVKGFGAYRLHEKETLSPLDAGGHGTHTASTAAGNPNVDAIINGKSYGKISGIAPYAHVAAYKVCWEEPPPAEGGCANADSVAAIDQAVADGVDVINYSISGSKNSFLDPVELAFMNAAEAGVFVAASSGNSGPAASTTAHASPWLTTVAASTHDIMEATVLMGNGDRYIGASESASLPASPLVYAGDVPAAGVEAAKAALCLPDTLDASKVAGKAVVCDRGTNARVEKSEVVKAAGGVGVVLVNVTEGSLDADLHSVPTVHLSHIYRDGVIAYARTEGATAQMLDTSEGTTTQIPEVAAFSSRGPSLAGSSSDIKAPGGALLKPDISAPGVSVLAAYSPDLSGGLNYNFVSGTSMSSPHIAGLGALMKQAHPKWSPMMIKSAMMTTARKHASAASNDPFLAGSGFVEPRRFLDPGLVYDSNAGDWWDFLAGQGVTRAGEPVSDNPIKPYNLNTPNVSIGQLVGKAVVERRVTNVTGKTMTWTSAVTGLEGLDVTVSPATLTLKPGETASYTITLNRASAALYEWTKGELVWTSGTYTAGSQIVARPVPASVPGNMSLEAGTTSFELPVAAGSDMTVEPLVLGMVAGVVNQGVVSTNSSAVLQVDSPLNYRVDFTVPTGYHRVRVQTKVADPTTGDVDLYVTRKGSSLALYRALTGSGNETVDMGYLSPGDYTIHVQGYSVPSADYPVTVRHFILPFRDAGNVSITPAELTLKTGEEGVFTATANLDPSVPWFGMIEFYDQANQRLGGNLVTIG